MLLLNKNITTIRSKILDKNQISSSMYYVEGINAPISTIDNIEIGSVKDNILIISCKNSSVATLMRFEKQKFIDLLSNNTICKIDNIRVTLVDYDWTICGSGVL